MRVIIAGSRDSTLRDVNRAMELCPWSSYVSTVLCGGARGADAAGEHWARRNGCFVEHHPAEWHRFGAAAGPIRNNEMARTAHGLIAVWDGESRGTADMLNKASKKGLRVFVYYTKTGSKSLVLGSDHKIESVWRGVENYADMLEMFQSDRANSEKESGKMWEQIKSAKNSSV